MKLMGSSGQGFNNTSFKLSVSSSASNDCNETYFTAEPTWVLSNNYGHIS